MADHVHEMRTLVEQATAPGATPPTETYSVATRQLTGVQSEARARQHVFLIDEPREWGEDEAANPAELLLAAIGSSIEITYRVYADLLGFPLAGVSTTVAADLDVLAFVDAPGAPPSFDEIRVDVDLVLSEPCGEARLAELHARVERCCPLLDVFRRPPAVAMRASATPASPSEASR